ncbi:hypothetical protein ACS52_11485 [Bacillus cereus]|nr:hypothetical protein ACS52_11485 [Bacillus cereus]
MNRYYLPEMHVFDRYEPRVRNNLINGYHRKMTMKHDYFVRYQLNNDRPFYTDASINEIVAELDGIEIINCNWTAEKWKEIPWRYYVTLGKVYEEYQGKESSLFAHGYNGHPVGKRKDGEWYFKYFDGRNCTYWRDRTSEIPTWHLRFGNIYANLTDDVLYTGIFSTMKVSKGNCSDIIIPVLRQMSAKKYEGFYDDEIVYILEQTGIDRIQI